MRMEIKMRRVYRILSSLALAAVIVVVVYASTPKFTWLTVVTAGLFASLAGYLLYLYLTNKTRSYYKRQRSKKFE